MLNRMTARAGPTKLHVTVELVFNQQLKEKKYIGDFQTEYQVITLKKGEKKIGSYDTQSITSKKSPDLLFICSIFWISEPCSHSNCYQGNTITKQIVPLPSASLPLEDLNQHHIELVAFQTHPGKRCQEQEVQ